MMADTEPNTAVSNNEYWDEVVADTVTPAPKRTDDTWIWNNLKVLAEDQTATEDKLRAVDRQVKIALGLGLLALGVGVVTVKAVSALMKSLGQVGNVVGQLATQAGMVAATAPQPPPQQTVRPTVSHDTPKPGWFEQPVPSTENVATGVGYDPGPQDIPDEVKRALASESIDPDNVKGGDDLT